MRVVKIKPATKRLKQLINEFGDEWEVLEIRKSVQCFEDIGILIRSLNHKHHRWIKYSDCSKLFTRKEDSNSLK